MPIRFLRFQWPLPLNANRVLQLLFVLAALAGCAVDRTVEGRALGTGETFTGTARPGGMLSSGSLSLQSSKGAKCEGRTLSAETVGSTVAVLTCDDGRAGSVILLDGPSQSVGTGLLGSDQVTLTITK